MFNFKQIFKFLTPQKKGTDQQPDPMNVGRGAYRDITTHGPNVNSDHLPFSQALGTFGVFPRPAPPGSIVVGIPAGNADGYVFPLGMLTGIFDGSQYDQPLNSLKEASKIELNIKIPPNIQSVLEQNSSGISKWTKEFLEKGQKFKQELLNGLPNNNTAYELMGVHNIPLTNIQTGIDQAITAMDSLKIASAGLQFLDIGNLLSNLDISGLTTSLQTTLNNATNMLQQDIIGSQPEWGAMAGTPISNASQLLNMAQSALDETLNEAQVLHILNVIRNDLPISNTGNVTITISTPFGELRQNVSSNGSITNIGNDLQNILNQLQSVVYNIEQGANGAKLFSENGTQLQEITGRMKDLNKQNEIHEFLTKLSNDFNEKKNRGRIKGTVGGNIQACRKQVVERKQATMIDGNILTFTPIDRSGQ